MITHAVLFRWRPSVAEEDISGLTARMLAVVQRLPQVRDYRLGPDLGLREGNEDFGVVATFDDREALAAYLGDDEHQKIIREIVAPMLLDRHAIQFES